ncbi:MAG: winged helix-turn-helix transcriptional regulator [Anaerolineales bacterium]|jgi:predicted ArsR family transcriptional regulator|nr:winged helix-turn-helix transcriptional regulator [Anaerolineales bacterium]
MTSTREKVLKTLLNQPRRTINELAEEVGINPISVRHHIASLQAEGLVTSEEEHHGVGRPRRVYFLTEAGAEKFPSRYIRLTLRLLEQLKDTMPETMVSELFTKIAQEMAEEYASDPALQNMNFQQRLNFAQELLKHEGFNIEWERTGDELVIHETSCPYYHVGQDHPEVCSLDQMLISSLLAVPAAKTRCILNGDNSCSYVISVPKQQDKLT